MFIIFTFILIKKNIKANSRYRQLLVSSNSYNLKLIEYFFYMLSIQ